MRKTVGWLSIVLFLFASLAQQVGAKEVVSGVTAAKDPEFGGAIEAEYMHPFQAERHIKTVSLNCFYQQKIVPGRSWVYYKGITLTRPWGRITRSGEALESSAWGAGPIFLARHQWWREGKLSLGVDACAGLIVYSEDFPAGGDIYNFMWRVGPRLAYQYSDRLELAVGCKVMHVSNGQFWHHDKKAHNPAYNAVGVGFGVAWK